MITRRSLFGLGAGVAATAVGISTTKAAPAADLDIINFAGQAFPEEFKVHVDGEMMRRTFKPELMVEFEALPDLFECHIFKCP